MTAASRGMRPRDLLELCTLAAIWGGSFLFMRVGAPEFGAVPLAGLRVAGAALVLMPLLALRGQLGALRSHWKPILLVGITNSAFPFMCFSYAALSLTAGLSGIFNAAAPLFGAVIAWLWMRERLTPMRTLGLVIGFAGVFGLAYSRAAVKAHADDAGALLAVLACIAGTVSYGFSANYTKRSLTGVAPLAVAAGSQLGAALALLVPTVLLWPARLPSAAAWTNLALLAVLCTGVAYILYFRLIANVGPANAITVTYLVPAFAVAWGTIFLGETLGPQTIAGCVVILLGTSLATGLLPRPPRVALRSGG
jgi:drug/metabolite transporter (DMT)-like permease